MINLAKMWLLMVNGNVRLLGQIFWPSVCCSCPYFLLWDTLSDFIWTVDESRVQKMKKGVASRGKSFYFAEKKQKNQKWTKKPPSKRKTPRRRNPGLDFVRQYLTSTQMCLGQDLQVLRSRKLSGRLQNLCHESTFAASLSHCDSSQNSAD